MLMMPFGVFSIFSFFFLRLTLFSPLFISSLFVCLVVASPFLVPTHCVFFPSLLPFFCDGFRLLCFFFFFFSHLLKRFTSTMDVPMLI